MSVILIGLMGSGKSIIGKLLASRLSLPFVDIDDYIVATEGRDIPTIFAEDGENKFRDIESNCLKACLDNAQSQVIATGGGAVLSECNRTLMKGHKVVWLTASIEILADRVGGDTNRPLLNDVDAYERMNLLAKQRNHLYAEVSGIEIDTGKLNDEEAVDKILKFLSE